MKRSADSVSHRFRLISDRVEHRRGNAEIRVALIEFAQLGYGVGVIDQHVAQNIFRVGSTHLGMAAQTVIIGSFTTWLMRSFIATLHSK